MSAQGREAAVAVEKIGAAAVLVAEKIGAAQALAAAQNSAIIQAQLAAGLCELKTAILANGDTTRALIRDNESRRLALELSDVKAELAVLKAAAPVR